MQNTVIIKHSANNAPLPLTNSHFPASQSGNEVLHFQVLVLPGIQNVWGPRKWVWLSVSVCVMQNVWVNGREWIMG